MRRLCSTALILLLAGSFLMLAMEQATPEEATPSAKLAKLDFSQWYKPVKFHLVTKKSNYGKPVDEKLLDCYRHILQKTGAEKSDPNLLTNGFVVVPKCQTASVASFYESLKDDTIPMFITVDAVLHLYHIAFSRCLSEMEEQLLHSELVAMTDGLKTELSAMLDAQRKKRGETDPTRIAPDSMGEQALWLALGYNSVISALLKGEWTTGRPDVDQELALIQGMAGLAISPLFKYQEDYSQYRPRGYYTKSEVLTRYFRTMMYMGRMVFLVKGKTAGDNAALVDHRDAKLQTLAALLISASLQKPAIAGKYCSVYGITSFFVGLSDDITPFEYSTLPSDTELELPCELSDEGFARIQARVLGMQPPAVYGGTGKRRLPSSESQSGEPSPEELAKALKPTTGMRMMGQRFTLDGYMMGKMCFPTIGKFEGTEEPLTGSPLRTFPSSLDLMSLLGSPQARQILSETQMDRYAGFEEAHSELQSELQGLKERDWQRNMYMGTLDVARTLLARHDDRQPFQRNDAWEYRQLVAALGSWSGLKHDTLLYSKQPNIPSETGLGPPRPPKGAGYVEPEPEVFAKLFSLSAMMLEALEALAGDSVWNTEAMQKLSSLNWFCAVLGTLSAKQLAHEPLTEDDVEFLLSVPDIMHDLQGEDKDEFNPSIVADVFTDADSGKVLEVGTGPMRAMVVVWAMPEGDVDLAVGTVYSWYEFLQPISNRLTDEKWREMLRDNPPAPPAWERHFVSPEK